MIGSNKTWLEREPFVENAFIRSFDLVLVFASTSGPITLGAHQLMERVPV